MKVLVVLAAGYVLGTRARREDVDEVVASVRAIRESGEFQDLLTSLRSYAVHGLRELASYVETGGAKDAEGLELVDGDGAPVDSSADLVDKVRRLAGLR